MSTLIEAEIRAWIECSRCGRTDKPSVRTQLPEDLGFSATEKVCARCERCHGHALMVLERAVRHLH